MKSLQLTSKKHLPPGSGATRTLPMEKKALKTPDPKVNYQTEVARDGSGSWQPFVRVGTFRVAMATQAILGPKVSAGVHSV